MKTKQYIQPALTIIKLEPQHLIADSTHGLNSSLQSTTVDAAWVKRDRHNYINWDEE